MAVHGTSCFRVYEVFLFLAGVSWAAFYGRHHLDLLPGARFVREAALAPEHDHLEPGSAVNSATRYETK